MAQSKQVSIRYFAALKEQSGIQREDFVTSASTASELFKELKQKHNFSFCPSQLRLAANENFEDMQYEIKDGDELVFLPPVAGG